MQNATTPADVHDRYIYIYSLYTLVLIFQSSRNDLMDTEVTLDVSEDETLFEVTEGPFAKRVRYELDD